MSVWSREQYITAYKEVRKFLENYRKTGHFPECCDYDYFITHKNKILEIPYDKEYENIINEILEEFRDIIEKSRWDYGLNYYESLLIKLK